MSINSTILVGNLGRAPVQRTQRSAVAPVAHDAKVHLTLAAQFALVGRELRVIVKHGSSYFEVQRLGECFTVSSVADLQGLLRQFQAADA